MVTKEGFPVSYDVLAGNTFEGHTLIPIIRDFIQNNKVEKMVVVADAAMISTKNVEELRENKINYIVGARLANLNKEIIEQIDQSLIRQDGQSIRITTDNGYLICTYSEKRYKKDIFEMDKQIKKAQEVIAKPSKAKKIKYTKTKDGSLELNKELQEKNKKLLGVKGYITDIKETELSNEQITDNYHQLYKVEHAFRISKNDLEARPVFHNKEEPVKLHVLICFMALAISKHIELQTGISIKKFISEAKKISDARMLNHITGKEIRIRAAKNLGISEILSKLNSPH